MSLHTTVTALLGIQHPVLSTPMAGISGGALAAAVTHAGALGFIGGEYGDETWLTRPPGFWSSKPGLTFRGPSGAAVQVDLSWARALGRLHGHPG
jgi:NAD(P)H-dependent flavin oxidoreductase YrpB (nitropropane dioxygenase family)